MLSVPVRINIEVTLSFSGLSFVNQRLVKKRVTKSVRPAIQFADGKRCPSFLRPDKKVSVM
jgi:hypothetical protein